MHFEFPVLCKRFPDPQHVLRIQGHNLRHLVERKNSHHFQLRDQVHLLALCKKINHQVAIDPQSLSLIRPQSHCPAYQTYNVC